MRDRARRGLAMLPSLLTLGNMVCGFFALVRIASVKWEDPYHPIPADAFQVAAIAILVGMVFDVLDGRVARMTRTTSEFGGQLDSLSDAVTFGIAPGVLVAMLHSMARYDFAYPFWSKMAWVFGAAYACGAVIRLARFNVETESPDEEHHRYFKGLPSPGAAGVIASLVLLYSFLLSPRAGEKLKWAQATTLDHVAWGIVTALPFVALVAGYLMVSKFRYVHFANYFLKGRKPFEYLAGAVFVGVLVALFPEISGAVLFCGFACSGPLLSLRNWWRGEPVFGPASAHGAVEAPSDEGPAPPRAEAAEAPRAEGEAPPADATADAGGEAARSRQ